MEQKKTLWIVAAAGIFLLVVVGAALIIYSPSLHKTPVQQASFDPATGWVNASSLTDTQNENPVDSAPDNFANQNPAYFDPLAQNSENSEAQATETESKEKTSETNAVINAQNVNVYAQETTTFDLNALKAASSGNTNVVAQNQKTAEQIEAANAAKEENSKAQENYYVPSSKSSSKSSSTTQTKSSSSSNFSSQASAKSSSSSSAKPAASAKTSASKTESAKKVAKASKTPSTLYWVQVGAYSSKKNADSARETLEENKIPVEVFTDNKYFKVRAGSFQTKSEAAYWQKIISEIGKFADSKTIIVNSSVQN